LKIYIVEPKTVVQSTFPQCTWVGKNTSDVVEVIEYITFPGGPLTCDLESNQTLTFNQTIVVNGINHVAEATSVLSRIIIKQGIDKSYDKCLSRYLAPRYQNDNFRNLRGRKTLFLQSISND
jgi:hypothetical protein